MASPVSAPRIVAKVYYWISLTFLPICASVLLMAALDKNETPNLLPRLSENLEDVRVRNLSPNRVNLPSSIEEYDHLFDRHRNLNMESPKRLKAAAVITALAIGVVGAVKFGERYIAHEHSPSNNIPHQTK